MQIFGVNTAEFMILLVLAMVLIGPDKLPEYIAKLRDWIRQARGMAEGAKSQLEEQMGPDFKDIDWRQYDPRQYDPRAIVRQALFDEPGQQSPPEVPDVDPVEPIEPDVEPLLHENDDSHEPDLRPTYGVRFDPDRATPWDVEAT
ncbi:hypothetical protein [Demetria terragena]|uniref:hypothetical protein n=1 Tax=Demetria terragena TaxID=63959 RepID=UPI000363C854|nr:hypothetical protein [Demetria terragena]